MSGNKWGPVVLIYSALFTLLAGQIFTYHAITHSEPTLYKAIESRLSRQASLLNALQPKGVSDTPILEKYLSDIRRDGLIPHATTKKKIDQLAGNTEVLLALLDAYQDANRQGPLKIATDEFRRYAIAWLDRRNSIMDLYLLGGNFPPGEPEFPKELIQALK